MNPSTYCGGWYGKLDDPTPFGVLIAQDYSMPHADGSELTGNLAAICGKCYHLMHSEHINGKWHCSDNCGFRVSEIKATTSLFYTQDIEAVNGHRDIRKWVSEWTGYQELQLIVTVSD